MIHNIVYYGGSRQRDFGKLFACYQYDNKMDKVAITFAWDTTPAPTIVAVDVVVSRTDKHTVLYSYVPGVTDDNSHAIDVENNVVTWVVDAMSTQCIGQTNVQVHVYTDDDVSGVHANFDIVVRQAHNVDANSYMEFPTAAEIAAAESARATAETLREQAEAMRNVQIQAALERCRLAAERAESIVIEVIPPTEWADIPDKPTSFPPSAHTHAQSDVTNLETALAGKETAGAAATVQGNLTTHTSNTTVHITAAERTTWNSKANGTHTHTKSDITDLASVITGNIYNTDSGTFSIATADWTENALAGRYEYTLSDASIETTSRVTIILGDAHKGKYNVWALDPTNGSVKICVDAMPSETIAGRWYTDEVRV